MTYKTTASGLKIFYILLGSFLFFCWMQETSFPATFDDLYTPLLERGNFFYEAQMYYFTTEEEGRHGDAAFDVFKSDPAFYSLTNNLTFSPLSLVEIEMGFKEEFPALYQRSTYDTAGAIASIQDYDLDFLQDYTLGLRTRHQPFEFYFTLLERRQKANWYGAYPPAAPTFFNYISSHFENINLEVRYLSHVSEESQLSTLSKLKNPLLDKSQMEVDFGLSYKKGKLRRRGDLYTPALFVYTVSHDLRPHLIPQISLGYGLTPNLELKTGVVYTTPFKYKYEYSYTDGVSFFNVGTYTLKDVFSLPFSLTFRPRQNINILFSSDFKYANQRLDYREKNTAGVLTRYPSKELKYYNVTPSLRVTYLYENNATPGEDTFSSLTKYLLAQGQFLVECSWQKDITHLDKNAANGTQNIIDPYNLFLYPVDYFVVGNEYSAFFAGNTSAFATNIQPQNYHTLTTTFLYGVSDSFNLGLRLGYHSESALHHFTLFDRNNRFYSFKPYYFVDLLWDWRLNTNTLLSFKSHLVPEYETILKRQSDPKTFTVKNSYLALTLGLQIVF